MSVVYVAGAARTGTATLGRALAADPSLLVVDVRALLLGRPDPVPWSDDDGFLDRVGRLAPVHDAAAVAYASRSVPSLAGVALGLRRTPTAVRVVVDRLQALGRLTDGRRLVDVSATAPGILLWPMAGHRVLLAHCVRSADVVAAPLGLVDHVATLAGSRLARCTRVTVPAHAVRSDPAAVAAALGARLTGPPTVPVAGDVAA